MIISSISCPCEGKFILVSSHAQVWYDLERRIIQPFHRATPTLGHPHTDRHCEHLDQSFPQAKVILRHSHQIQYSGQHVVLRSTSKAFLSADWLGGGTMGVRRIQGPCFSCQSCQLCTTRLGPKGNSVRADDSFTSDQIRLSHPSRYEHRVDVCRFLRLASARGFMSVIPEPE